MATATHERTNGSMIDLAELPPDLALMRIENDNIQAMATARPRDLEQVKENVLGQLAIFPAMASQMIYSKPVGKDDDGVMQFARNLSVRAAEMLAEAYGFNRVSAKTTLIDGDHAQVEATFVDYQRGRIWTESNPVSRIQKKRTGGTRIIDEDRFLNIVCKAERSKVIREAILRCVPPGLKQALFEAADKEMSKLLKPEHMTKIVASFATKGVTLEQLERLIGRTQKQGWLAADRQRLAELWNAIENEEATVAEIFGAERPEPAAANGNGTNGNGHGSGVVTGDDLANPKGSATAHPHADKAPQKPADDPAAKAESKPEPTVEREPGDDPDEPEADESQAPPDWYVRLEEEISGCTLIRDLKAVGEKYYGKESPLSTTEKALAVKAIENAQEKLRQARGPRSNKGQEEMFGGEG